MTLAQRLLAATAVLTVATALVLGFGVREAWRRTEESRFLSEFHRAVADLQTDLQREVKELPRVLEPLCAHEPLVDSALVGRKSGDLPERRLSIGLRVPEMMRANRLDELTLMTDQGEILGRGQSAASVGHGTSSEGPAQAKAMRGQVVLRTTPPRAFETACVKGNEQAWVALMGARHLEPLLEAASRRHGVDLDFEDPLAPSSKAEARRLGAERPLVSQVTVPELGGQKLWAARSRTRLTAALRELDVTIAALGASTILVALLVAIWIARGLARPVVEFALQAREVVRGTPRPIAASGGRELAEAAAAFNQTLADLASLKNRLAATERIAARREVARRVAHEIKNPLAPIRASIETLRRLHARQDPAFQEYFDEATRTVLGEVSRINHIVAEFTRYERLPAPRLESFDVVEAARSVVQLHQSQGVPIHFEAGACPPLRADRDQVIQVLTNLIQNAQDALGGHPAPLIRVELEPNLERGQLLLSVEDNGPGVPEEFRARLFEPYATSKAQGTGLGLAIAQRIAIEHGGELVYAGEGSEGPGRRSGMPGARFVLRLPLDGPPRLETPNEDTGSDH